MALPPLDFALGKAFSRSIEVSLGRSVGYVGQPFSGEFFLLASFSRSRFKLTEASVGTCLQYILGGNPSSFAISCLDDPVFRFAVSCKEVALAVLRLGSFASSVFKVAFLFCNDHGYSATLDFSKSDSGPSFDWVEIRSKKRSSFSNMTKNTTNFADIVKNQAPVLSGANATPPSPLAGRMGLTLLVIIHILRVEGLFWVLVLSKILVCADRSFHGFHLILTEVDLSLHPQDCIDHNSRGCPRQVDPSLHTSFSLAIITTSGEGTTKNEEATRHTRNSPMTGRPSSGGPPIFTSFGESAKSILGIMWELTPHLPLLHQPFRVHKKAKKPKQAKKTPILVR